MHGLTLSGSAALIHVLNCQLPTAFRFHFTLNLAHLKKNQMVMILWHFNPFVFTHRYTISRPLP